MHLGFPYCPADDELVHIRQSVKKLCYQLNQAPPDDLMFIHKILVQIFSRVGHDVDISPMFHCVYGMNIELGDDVVIGPYANFEDHAHIKIGHHVVIGSHTCLCTRYQPQVPDEIISGVDINSCEGIFIGNYVNIGSHCVIHPGVSIGEAACVEAGSIVTKSIEPYGVVSGNPAKLIRRLR